MLGKRPLSPTTSVSRGLVGHTNNSVGVLGQRLTCSLPLVAFHRFRDPESRLTNTGQNTRGPAVSRVLAYFLPGRSESRLRPMAFPIPIFGSWCHEPDGYDAIFPSALMLPSYVQPASRSYPEIGCSRQVSRPLRCIEDVIETIQDNSLPPRCLNGSNHGITTLPYHHFSLSFNHSLPILGTADNMPTGLTSCSHIIE